MPDVKDKLLKGYKAGNKTFKVHLDGYNLLPYLTGQEPKSPRQEFFYFSDDGDLTGLRYDNWKLVFAQQRAPGTLAIWGEPFVKTADSVALQPAHRPLRAGDHHLEHLLGLAASTMPSCSCRRSSYVGQFLATFKEYPPRQKAASFTIDQVMEQLQTPANK